MPQPTRINIAGILQYAAFAVVLSACAGGEGSQIKTLAIPGLYEGHTGLERAESQKNASGQATADSSVLSDTSTHQNVDEPIRERYPGSDKLIGRPVSSTTQVQVDDATIQLNFENSQIREFLRFVLGEGLDVPYVVDARVRGVVNLRTTQPVPRSVAMELVETVLRMNGAAMVVEETGVYRIVPFAEVLTGSLRPELAAPGDPIPPGYQIRIVPLRFISADQMDELLQPFASRDVVVRIDKQRNILVLAGTGAEVGRLIETVNLFDVDWLAGRSVGIYQLRQASPADIISEIEVVLGTRPEGPLAEQIEFLPLNRLNAILAVTTNGRLLQEAERWVERLDRGSQTGENLYVYYLEYGKAADLADILTEAFSETSSFRNEGQLSADLAPGRTPVQIASGNPRAAVQVNNGTVPPRRINSSTSSEGIYIASSGAIRIIADDVNNALLVRCTASEYAMIEAAISKLDILPLQVLIEATVAEVTLTDDLRFGLQWLFNSGNLGNGYSGQGTLSASTSDALGATFPGFSYVVSDSDGGARVVLDALEDLTKVNVISSPHLMVLDNHQAELKVGNEVPVVVQQQQSTADNTANLVNTVEFRDTGVILRVTPRVTAAGSVNIEIEQEVSSVSEDRASGQLTPTISQRRITSSIVAQSGETIILGGLISDSVTTTKSGVPYLSRIPGLGALFRNSVDQATRTELIILVTPRVVSSQAEARRVTRELRQRLRGLDAFETQDSGQSTHPVR